MTEPPRRILLLGGTSEIGLAILRAMQLDAGARVVLAGRDEVALRAAAAALPASLSPSYAAFDALEPESVSTVVNQAFDDGPIDLVVPAFGVLGDQALFEREPAAADALLTINVVAQTRALLESARRLREQGHGTVVVLSSVAAVRPRRANFVYGASKVALDATARGLADALHGTGVRVVLVRPGFVIGRMTHGMQPAPLATTPDVVGAAVATALTKGQSVVWVPPSLRMLAGALRTVPRPLWRRIPR